MDFTKDLSDRIGKLLYDDESSDITFIVEGERIAAHKLILSTSSDYFRALLRGGLKESFQDTIVLNDVRLNGFKQLMSFIYTGRLNLEDADEDTTLDLLETAHLYGFDKIQSTICQYLKKTLSYHNAWRVFNIANRLKLEQLTEACCRQIERAPNESLASEDFRHLPAASICRILSRDTFCAEEINVFRAVEEWCKVSPQDENDASKVLKLIRLPLMSTIDLATIVKNSGLFSAEQILDAIAERERRLLKKEVSRSKQVVRSPWRIDPWPESLD